MPKPRRRLRAPEPRDYGTAELRQHHVIRIEGTREPHARVVDQTPLDRYHARGLLHATAETARAMHDAGERLRADWRLAGLEPRVVAELVRVDSGHRISEGRRLDAWARIQRAAHDVGVVLWPVLRAVVCCDEPASAWARGQGLRGRRAEVAGLTALRLALGALAVHYGLLREPIFFRGR